MNRNNRIEISFIGSTPEKSPTLSDAEIAPETIRHAEKIRNYIRENRIKKCLRWSDPEFVNYYFSEKAKIAIDLCRFLKDYEKPYARKKQNAEEYLNTGEKYLQRAYRKIRAEEQKMIRVFRPAKGLPKVERDKKILTALHLNELFDGTEPYLFHSKNVLVAVLNEEDYGKVQDEDSAGVFWVEKHQYEGESDIAGAETVQIKPGSFQFPIVLIKAVSKMNDFDLRALYQQMLEETTHRILFRKTKISSSELIKLTDAETAKKLKAQSSFSLSETEQLTNLVFEKLSQAFPFEAWYASKFLELLPSEHRLFKDKKLDKSQLKENEEFSELHVQARETIRHEFHHSACRFLPVHQNQKETSDSKADILNYWLSRLAEEIVIYSYANEEIDPDFYLKMYLSEQSHLSAEDKQFLIDEFAKKTTLFLEINRRLIKSEHPRLLSTLFSLEPIHQWKFLHEFLMSGGLPEHGYLTTKEIPKTDE